MPSQSRPLSKSEFLAFLACEKDAWLARHRPDAFERPAPGAFDRLLMVDGYAVEAMARELFASRTDADEFAFQVDITDGPCLARADIVRTMADGSVEIYEVKSSSSPKDHIADACFQRIVAERAGLHVAASYIVHVNADYRRDGEPDPNALLVVAPVGEQIAATRDAIRQSIDRALATLAEPEIDATGCGCVAKSRAQRCAAFSYLNASLPDPSIHVLPRMGGARLSRLANEGRLSIHDATVDDVTPAQAPVLAAFHARGPIIDRDAIRAFLAAMPFPLHFYDYETAGAAIPAAQGHGPHQQIPVQFSCHVLEEDGTITHHEFLADGHGQEADLVEGLRTAIGPVGSLVVWNESFEKGCNRRMAELLPEHASFLEDLNSRTFDLMTPFKAHYVDPRFAGSTSIKKVLPVLCPHLSYEGMPVHDGTGAILAFRAMAASRDPSLRGQIRRQLLDYCHLDSLAMVEIHRILAETARGCPH